MTALLVLEFLNLLCYRADKMKEKERQEREWLRRH